MKNISEILGCFEGVRSESQGRQWIAKCPCHDDRKASLSIGLAESGKILIHCQAGCDTRNILDSVGLSFADINPSRKVSNPAPKDRPNYHHPIATYIYSNGTRKQRDANKNFWWQHLENGEWKPRRGDAPHVPYFDGNPQNKVYIPEGEKDVDSLSALGFYCACSENGAGHNSGGKKWYDSYNEFFKGKDIRILPDNDEIGRQFAITEALELKSVAKSIKILDLKSVFADLPEKGDVSDLISMIGATKAKELILKLETETPEWKPAPSNEESQQIFDSLAVEKSGEKKIPVTSENILKILESDPRFDNVRFNIMRGYPEKIVDGKRIAWSDSDDASARTYIESAYKLANKQKYEDAFAVFGNKRKYHPVQERINSFVWDGFPRVEKFLSNWMGADDTPFNRECSRLLFAGGINRAYKAGCKFDCVIVLIGAQGAGKSSLCRWLAMDDDFYASIKTISGQKGYESIQGIWICEIEELLATLANDKSGRKPEELAKAFLSEQSDYYRRPYERRPTYNPRNCIFVGTTNRSEFLTDKTGNRRWFPVHCKQSAKWLYDHESDCKEAIQQCWAEMLVAYKAGDILASPTPRTEILNDILAKQEDAEVDDCRIGLIEEYIADKGRVCIYEIWRDVFHAGVGYVIPQITRRESNEIADILVNKLHWTRGNSINFGEGVGQQKAYYPPNNEVAKTRNVTELPL